MKKRLVILITFLLVAAQLASCAASAGENPVPLSVPDAATKEPILQEAPNAEISRAISYGFVPQSLQTDYDATITAQEYCAMLRAMLEQYDSSVLSAWDETTSVAAASTRSMKRDDAMLATYYAACQMGIGEYPNGDWLEIHTTIGESGWDDLSWDYPDFPKYSEPSPFQDNPGRTPGWDYITSAYFFCLGQNSNVSNRPLFDYDPVEKSMHCNESCTRQDAIQAVVRLYESIPGFRLDLAEEPGEWATAFLEKVDVRRDGILNSETTIVPSDSAEQGIAYSGKAYYVSNQGSDDNNGLTPETAWATLDKVNGEKLAKGDAVFFERGGIWYGTLKGKTQVTYSAYGEGAKPLLNGRMDVHPDDPTNWNLQSEGTNGERIWMFEQPLPQVAGVFFNNGKQYGERLFLNWDSMNNQYVTNQGEVIDPETMLNRDLMYFSAPDITGYSENDYLPNGGYIGQLYLRCDQGNPAEVFQTIELSFEGNGAEAYGNQVTFDNLSIANYGGCGVICNGDQFSGTRIQNCEIAYCGGFISAFYRQNEYPYWEAVVTGGAIHICGQDNTAVNNYIHDCDSKCFIIVYSEDEDDITRNESITMNGNLIENSCTALYIGNFADNSRPDNTNVFRNILFKDNYVLNTGNCWGFVRLTQQEGGAGNLSAIDLGNYRNANENFQIVDNTFYLGKAAFVYGHMAQTDLPIFSGNTFAPGANTMLAIWHAERVFVERNNTNGAYAEDWLSNTLQDKTGQLIINP